METNETQTKQEESPVIGEIIPDQPENNNQQEQKTQQAPTETFDENGVKSEAAPTADDRLNKMILKELETTGAQHVLTIFFETGQISSFPINIDREALENRMRAGGFVTIPEVKDADGFKDGKVLINMNKIIFSIIRSKSLIHKPDNRLILAGR